MRAANISTFNEQTRHLGHSFKRKVTRAIRIIPFYFTGQYKMRAKKGCDATNK